MLLSKRGDEKNKRLDFSLLASVEDAGRGSESAASIFSSPRLFSFRRTFRVQQQSDGMLLQTGFHCGKNKCLRAQPRPLSPSPHLTAPHRTHCFVKSAARILRTLERGRTLIIPPLCEEKQARVDQSSRAVNYMHILYTAAACNM